MSSWRDPAVLQDSSSQVSDTLSLNPSSSSRNLFEAVDCFRLSHSMICWLAQGGRRQNASRAMTWIICSHRELENFLASSLLASFTSSRELCLQFKLLRLTNYQRRETQLQKFSLLLITRNYLSTRNWSMMLIRLGTWPRHVKSFKSSPKRAADGFVIAAICHHFLLPSRFNHASISFSISPLAEEED